MQIYVRLAMQIIKDYNCLMGIVLESVYVKKDIKIRIKILFVVRIFVHLAHILILIKLFVMNA